MSQPQRLSDIFEFLPPTEPRTPLPITNLPVNAITEDVDPTLEIRTLIEQLQQSSRDARTQMHAVEQERDAIAGDLARAEQQIEALRTNELELRSRFVEITAVIRERDTAVEESERRSATLLTVQKNLETATRELQEAQRQREEAQRHSTALTRQLEAQHRGHEEQTRLIAETQRQILAIRQARDTAHHQILELTNKLNRAEDERAEFEYQQELAQQAAKKAAGETGEFRRQLEAVSLDRDATAKQVEQLTQELDEQRKKFLDLAAQESAVMQADSEHTAALCEARAQVGSLSQERDSARLRAAEQTRELEELRQQFQIFRDEQTAQASAALAEAHEKMGALETQAREARHQVRNLQQQYAAATEQLSSLQKSAAENSGVQADVQNQLEIFGSERDTAMASLEAAQRQLDELTKERDAIRALAHDNAVEMSAQVTALQAQLTALEANRDQVSARSGEARELTVRLEKQRLESIDLATQLQNAQRQIRELSASVAEARLQAKFAHAASRAAKAGTSKSDFAQLLTSTEPPPLPEPNSLGDPLLVPLHPPLEEKEIRSALSGMRQCLLAFSKKPEDLSLLNELHCYVHSFAERARTSGMDAVYRLSSAFSDLTRGLYEIPEQLNPSTLRTVQQTVEILGAVMKDVALAQSLKSPASALVYAVEDDPDNSQSIVLAMQTAMMRTSTAAEPAVALAELATMPCDLIILDVNLPGMDGFALCKLIRELPEHLTTPVLFLTGVSSLDARVQSSISGANDLVAKPFNVHELMVKSLSMILKAQLHLD